jgi:hypothetical protein
MAAVMPSRRTLALGAIVLACYTIWALPPFPQTALRQATRLAHDAGCPRALPIMPSDFATTLDSIQVCGVVWAALNTLPDSVRDFISTPAHLRQVRILVFYQSSALYHHGTSSIRVSPPPPWWEYQRIKSSWNVGIAVLGGTVGGVYSIAVDRRTGVAYRRVGIGSSASKTYVLVQYAILMFAVVALFVIQLRSTHRRLSRDMRGPDDP